MAVTIDSHNTDCISLSEYIDFCDSHPQLLDPDEAMATADRLKALSNNKHFLASYLNNELKNVYQFQEGNDFKPPTFLIHRGEYYTIRAVVWLPLDDELLNPAMFSYFEPHDHNFDFLTCGYHGSGYRTVIFQYEHEKVIGFPGEKVRLEFSEETTLSDGKLMYYFSSKDVHIQYPPEELSISLNLILPRTGKPRRQYEFDIERQTIMAQMNDMPMRRAIFSAVRHIGNENSMDMLLSIGRQHSCLRTRALSWETLMFRDPRHADKYLSVAMNDRSEYVKTLARKAYDRCGTSGKVDAPVSG